jgi:hypothetical protein
MSSLVLYANEFDGHLNNGLAPQLFKYRLLVEGDSWMDRSAMFHTSLLQKLAPKMDAAGDDVLIINLSRFGDTMRRMGDLRGRRVPPVDRYRLRLEVRCRAAERRWQRFHRRRPRSRCRQGHPEESGRRTPAGTRPGLPRPRCGRHPGRRVSGAKLCRPLQSEVQASRHAGVPIFLNLYDTPVARDAPAFPGGRSWLFEAYRKNAIPPQLWPDLTGAIFADVQRAVRGGRPVAADLHCVPTTGTLAAADPDATASSGDWLNEIHPNAAGWEKLAGVWQKAIKQVLT